VRVLGALVATGLLFAGLVPYASRAPSAQGPVAIADVAKPEREAERAPAPVAAAKAPRPCVPAPLEQRAAQVLVVGLPGVEDAADPLAREVAGLGVGGILLTKTNVSGAAQVRVLVAGLRAASPMPLLVATDEEPGRVSSFGTVLGRSSSARTLASRGTEQDVRSFAREIGTGLAGLGVDLDLAPVADLDAGPASGIVGDRSFSADPATASRYSVAFSQGLADAGVLAAAKHFPGHGRSATDSHDRLETVDTTLPELRATDLAPFAEQIAIGVPVVMLGHVGYSVLDPDLPASLSPRAYALLREMGFEGVAMTDSLGMGAVNRTWAFPEAAVLAVSAGADALLATQGEHALAMRDALVTAVRDGRLPEARLDEAATRVLALKGVDPVPVTCTNAPPPN